MGIVRMGAPFEIIFLLQENYRIKNFIETGTYGGDTAYCASQVFERVFTIEYSQVIYEIVADHFKEIKNINFIYGDSREKLKDILSGLEEASLFWLDAHWSGELTYGQLDQCPLIQEIEIINSSEYEHFILIDDARLFLSPPPSHNLMEQWPDITTVLKYLNLSNRYIVIIEDVIIAVPEFAKTVVAEYCQKVSNEFWKNYKQTNINKSLLIDLNGQEIPLLNRPSNIKIIVFPDWDKPEDSLQEVIDLLIKHPESSRITLIINVGDNNYIEEARLILSSIILKLGLQEDLHLNNNPEILLLGDLPGNRGEYMLYVIHARLILPLENEQSIAKLRAERLTAYTIEEFKNKPNLGI